VRFQHVLGLGGKSHDHLESLPPRHFRQNIRGRFQFQRHRAVALDLLFAAAFGRKSATAAVLMITVLWGKNFKTAASISSAVSTRVVSAASGAAIAVGPLTSSTRAPRRSAASAIA